MFNRKDIKLLEALAENADKEWWKGYKKGEEVGKEKGYDIGFGAGAEEGFEEGCYQSRKLYMKGYNDGMAVAAKMAGYKNE